MGSCFGVMGKLLGVQVRTHQSLEQFVPVDFPDQASGIVVGGDVGGVLREDISHDLIDRIISFFVQCLIDFSQYLTDLLFFFVPN